MPIYDLRPIRIPLTAENSPNDEKEVPVMPELSDYRLFSSLIIRRLFRVRILDASKRPDPDDLGLDASQTAAFYAALTQQLTVIQGPPGTGKTFIGLRIVQTLLHNSRYWSSIFIGKSPILVVCYTNHALDQFLKYSN